MKVKSLGKNEELEVIISVDLIFVIKTRAAQPPWVAGVAWIVYRQYKRKVSMNMPTKINQSSYSEKIFNPIRPQCVQYFHLPRESLNQTQEIFGPESAVSASSYPFLDLSLQPHLVLVAVTKQQTQLVDTSLPPLRNFQNHYQIQKLTYISSISALSS